MKTPTLIAFLITMFFTFGFLTVGHMGLVQGWTLGQTSAVGQAEHAQTTAAATVHMDFSADHVYGPLAWVNVLRVIKECLLKLKTKKTKETTPSAAVIYIQGHLLR
ncbi:MAG: hypothetical protein U0Z75_05820 [Deinococcaceae bacterium]